ncbi:MAG: DUF2007 domain-containing protein [Bacteroidales bacterium]|nr:DUF2007 domain-containing protein [Bacteroidales bacterium]
MEDKQKFVTVATFLEVNQANITAAMLNDNGIPAAVFGFDSSYPQLGFAKAIEVKVNESDLDAARKLLDIKED